MIDAFGKPSQTDRASHPHPDAIKNRFDLSQKLLYEKGMKKTAETSNECVKRLQATADALATSGADLSSIIAALVQVTVSTARKERRSSIWLDSAASIFMNAADRAFEQEKKARAGRRRKSQKE